MANENREAFLANIAKALGRPQRFEAEPMGEPVNDLPQTRFTDLTEAERYEAFLKNATDYRVDIVTSTKAKALDDLYALIERYGNGKIIVNNDSRLPLAALKAKYQDDLYVWDEQAPEKTNIDVAAVANIGIVFAEYGLCETGGIVLFSGPNCGRSVSLLPPNCIVMVKRSTILPRVAQLSEILDKRALSGERMPSCINIVSGPSATADIELVKVMGAHGPVTNGYVVIADE